MGGTNLPVTGFTLCLLVACQLELGEGDAESSAADFDASMPPVASQGSTDEPVPAAVPTDPISSQPPVPTPVDNPSPSPSSPAPEPTAPSEDCTPDYDCDPEPPDTGDPYADCVERINQFRACACLPPLERNHDAEACLDQQSEHDSSNGAHAGFSDRICEPNGHAQNECPGWGSERDVVEGCIRMMFYEGPPSEEPCEGRCYSEHGHFINMTSTRSTKVACGFFDADGEVWSVQNFFR